MPEIVFPVSNGASRHPTENGGRLINAYAEPAPEGSRSRVIHRRVPGLTDEFDVGVGVHRGALQVGTVLYLVNGSKGYTVTYNGTTYTVTELSGSVSGTGRVIMARNMKSPTPDILVVTSAGMHSMTASAVSSFSDADLPTTNSVCFMDGYFFFGIADGRCFASGVNATTVASTDYATAEASTDSMVRVVPKGNNLLLMGSGTIEFWNNTANPTGFPFSRGTVVTTGLLSAHAVAGYEPAWTGPLLFVGSDRKVHQLDGYTPVPVSPPELDRLIQEISDTTELEASVYVFNGRPCWSLSSSEWTWVFDLSTRAWHQRESYQADNWRIAFTLNMFDKWLAFDRTGQKVLSLSASQEEDQSPLIWEVRSTQAHRFPGRFRIDRASFDFVTGVGIDQGRNPTQTDPKVSIDWSDDGGRTFGNPLLRNLGSQGEVTKIDVWRCGIANRHGRQWRLRVSDAVEVALLGGAMDIEELAA